MKATIRTYYGADRDRHREQDDLAVHHRDDDARDKWAPRLTQRLRQPGRASGNKPGRRLRRRRHHAVDLRHGGRGDGVQLRPGPPEHLGAGADVPGRPGHGRASSGRRRRRLQGRRPHRSQRRPARRRRSTTWPSSTTTRRQLAVPVAVLLHQVGQHATSPPAYVDCSLDGDATKCSTIEYKSSTRKHVEDDMGLHIIANFGDQFSDLIGGSLGPRGQAAEPDVLPAVRHSSTAGGAQLDGAIAASQRQAEDDRGGAVAGSSARRRPTSTKPSVGVERERAARCPRGPPAAAGRPRRRRASRDDRGQQRGRPGRYAGAPGRPRSAGARRRRPRRWPPRARRPRRRPRRRGSGRSAAGRATPSATSPSDQASTPEVVALQRGDGGDVVGGGRPARIGHETRLRRARRHGVRTAQVERLGVAQLGALLGHDPGEPAGARPGRADGVAGRRRGRASRPRPRPAASVAAARRAARRPGPCRRRPAASYDAR